ncbi:MAG: tetratricopeptide repeat protein, partial [Candidatus Rokuibacteriota bacterium]
GELLRRAEEHRARGERDEELRALDDLVRADPAWPGAHLAQGMALFAAGRYEEAEASLRASIRLDPAGHSARLFLAKARGAQNDERDAESILSALLEEPLEPQTELGVRADLARVFARSTRQAEALAQIDLALRLAERLGGQVGAAGELTLVHMQGLILFEMSRLPEAAACMERVVALRPERGQDWYNLASVYSRLERADDALNALDRAFTRSPDLRQGARNDQELAFLRSSRARDFGRLVGR